MKFQNLRKGIGSLVEIYPSKIKLNLPKRKTAEQRMQDSWNKTGKSLSKVIGNYESDRK